MIRMKINDVITVLVTKVHPSYVRVEYQGKEAILQITELTWKAGKIISADYVKEGDDIRVKVIDVEGDKFSVSMRQASLGGNPWLSAPQVNDEFFAPVVAITDFGVFLELSYYCHGLLRSDNLNQNFQLGDRIKVRVVFSNPDRQRVEVIEA